MSRNNNSNSHVNDAQDLQDIMKGHLDEEQRYGESDDEIAPPHQHDYAANPPQGAVPPPPPPPPHPPHQTTHHGPTMGVTSRRVSPRSPLLLNPHARSNPTYSSRPSYPHISPPKERSYKSPLQPQQLDHLTSAAEWPIWERRVRSRFRSIPGYGEQIEVGTGSVTNSRM